MKSVVERVVDQVSVVVKRVKNMVGYQLVGTFVWWWAFKTLDTRVLSDATASIWKAASTFYLTLSSNGFARCFFGGCVMHGISQCFSRGL